MKALVFNGPGNITLSHDHPEPTLQSPSDAIVTLLRTTICGTDLHILHGAIPSVPNGRVLGHEGIGRVLSVGRDVKRFRPGDRVLIACITSCGACNFCRRELSAFCETGGWCLGHTTDGTQAERVRVPHADASLHLVPEGADERGMLVLSDILPTGLEVGVLRGGVKPGCSVAIVGAGPVGLASLLTAQLYSPSVIVVLDKDKNRLAVAKRMGATHTVDVSGGGDVKELTREQHGEIDGFDVVVEAVGAPAAFETCQELVGKGGSIANVGVHGQKVDLHMEKLWGRGIRKCLVRLEEGVGVG